MVSAVETWRGTASFECAKESAELRLDQMLSSGLLDDEAAGLIGRVRDLIYSPGSAYGFLLIELPVSLEAPVRPVNGRLPKVLQAQSIRSTVVFSSVGNLWVDLALQDRGLTGTGDLVMRLALKKPT